MGSSGEKVGKLKHTKEKISDVQGNKEALHDKKETLQDASAGEYKTIHRPSKDSKIKNASNTNELNSVKAKENTSKLKPSPRAVSETEEYTTTDTVSKGKKKAKKSSNNKLSSMEAKEAKTSKSKPS